MPLKFLQKITYWLPLGSNGTGGKTWQSGKVISGRVSSVDEEFFTEEGKKVWGNQAVYAFLSIPAGAYIVVGEYLGDVAPTSDARQVIKSSTNPTMTKVNRMLLQ